MPGPYYLMPEQDTKTEEDLRRVIDAAIAKKERFTAVRSIADPAKRVAALASYVEGDETNGWYFTAAVRELAKAGPIAGPLLRRELLRPREPYRREALLEAIGDSGDPEAVPYLLDIVDRAAPFVKAIKLSSRKPLTEAERATLREMTMTIYVLSEMADRRALPALRDAMLLGVTRDYELFEHATHGLESMPTPENIPFLAQALASIPAGKNSSVVNACLDALMKHRYPEAVPILAAQLNFPARPKPGFDAHDYNAGLAHHILKEIVGKDLGTGKKAWIKWYEAQKK
jgi:HEAT repeat protein